MTKRKNGHLKRDHKPKPVVEPLIEAPPAPAVADPRQLQLELEKLDVFNAAVRRHFGGSQ